MRVVFSRDRPAQLDLLLRSLDEFALSEQTIVVTHASSVEYERGYDLVAREHERVEWASDQAIGFDYAVRAQLERADYLMFFCDDNVIFRKVFTRPDRMMLFDSVLTYSWRLAASPNGSLATATWWDWTGLPRTDHGYPGSVDGHLFRTSDLKEMLSGSGAIDNPTVLETILAERCEGFAVRRPYMASPPYQVLVGVPVNRVSPLSGCPYGEQHKQPTDDLNRRFLGGERISLAATAAALEGVASCHQEIAYQWVSP